jgi:hypothetical protein
MLIDLKEWDAGFYSCSQIKIEGLEVASQFTDNTPSAQ